MNEQDCPNCGELMEYLDNFKVWNCQCGEVLPDFNDENMIPPEREDEDDTMPQM